MAEFLIFNKEHWMDSLTQEEIDVHIAKNPDFQRKYDARYQKGDIVERRLDGFWTDGTRGGFGAPDFALIVMPWMSFEDSEKYVEMILREELKEYNTAKSEYLEDAKVKIFKYNAEIIEEYKKIVNIPGIGLTNIDWVNLRGIVDVIDKRRRYQMDMTQITLDAIYKKVLSSIEDAHITDKSK